VAFPSALWSAPRWEVRRDEGGWVHLRDLFRLLSDERPRIGWWAVLIALAVAHAALELLISLAVLVLMRVFLEAEVAATAVLGGTVSFLADMPSERLKLWLALGLLVLLVIRTVMIVAVSYLGARLSTMASVRIARKLLEGYVHQPYFEHTQRRSSDMVRDTFLSTERLTDRATLPLTMVITDGIVSLGLLAALFVVDPIVTMIAAGFLAVAIITVQRAIRPRLHTWGRLSQESTSSSLEVLQQALAGMRDIRLLGQEPRFLAQHDRERTRLARYRYLSNAGMSVPRSIIEFATLASIVVLLAVFSRTSDATGVILPVLGMFAYVGLRLQPVLNRIIVQINEIRSSQALVQDLLVERSRLDVAAIRPDLVEPCPPPTSHDVVFDGVSFAYPSAEGRPARTVLRDVDLRIPSGAFVGILGPTGAGKSTLLDLLVGLLRPTAGRILVGGVVLGAAPGWWWRRLGVVSQSVYLAPGTIRDNVAFSAEDPADPMVEQRVWESLAIAQLDATVRDLPYGLDTPVGEAGVRFSGGQRQRLALARAIFRDPPVLILDEGTSALDEQTEADVMAAFRADRPEGSPPRTLVVVTHRTAAVADADLRFRVADGRVVQ
jgi:ATP-binding cassette, subfamily B, bacterial PglK